MQGFKATQVPGDAAHVSNQKGPCVAEIGATNAVISCNSLRRRPIPHNRDIFKAGNRVERCFDELKHFRHIATRYDRRMNTFLAFILIACAKLWMR